MLLAYFSWIFEQLHYFRDMLLSCLPVHLLLYMCIDACPYILSCSPVFCLLPRFPGRLFVGLLSCPYLLSWLQLCLLTSVLTTSLFDAILLTCLNVTVLPTCPFVLISSILPVSPSVCCLDYLSHCLLPGLPVIVFAFRPTWLSDCSAYLSVCCWTACLFACHSCLFVCYPGCLLYCSTVCLPSCLLYTAIFFMVPLHILVSMTRPILFYML